MMGENKTGTAAAAPVFHGFDALSGVEGVVGHEGLDFLLHGGHGGFAFPEDPGDPAGYAVHFGFLQAAAGGRGGSHADVLLINKKHLH